MLVAGNNDMKYYFENKSNKGIPRKKSGVDTFVIFYMSSMQILNMSSKE